METPKDNSNYTLNFTGEVKGFYPLTVGQSNQKILIIVRKNARF